MHIHYTDLFVHLELNLRFHFNRDLNPELDHSFLPINRKATGLASNKGLQESKRLDIHHPPIIGNLMQAFVSLRYVLSNSISR